MPFRRADTRWLGRGFSLIELLVAITIFGILSALAIPMYGTFMANSQIRTATESMLAGVRQAQTEAVRRNGTVEFVLDPANGWTVNSLEGAVATPVSSASFKEGAAKTTITPAGGERRVTFNGLGRICCGMPPVSPVDNTAPLTRVDVTSTSGVSNPRDLRLVVGTAYGIKVCDPAMPSTDPTGCP